MPESERDRFGFVSVNDNDQDKTNTIRNMELQKNAWIDFLASRNNKFDDVWLWQYWREESRYKNQLNKRFMSMFSSRLTQQKQMKELIRRGVPDELRPKVWWACSGAQQKMENSKKEEQFGALVQRIREIENSTVSFDIEKDLNRTFPNSELLGSRQSLSSLRKILYAYALRNPVLGYCQSMNFISCTLLVYLSEEQAFWVLCCLIEDIIPVDYYSRSMIGSRIDQMVFEACIAWKLPKIHSRFKEVNMLIEPVTCPWILCLYTTALPMEYVCRIWDCLLWEGNVVLLRVGLVMLKLKQNQLLQAEDFVEIYSILRSAKSTAYDIDSVETIPEPSDYITINKSRTNSGKGGIFTSPGAMASTSPTTSSSNNNSSSSISSPSISNSKHSVFNMLGTNHRDIPMLSKLDMFMYLAFDKKWIKSIPRESVASMRNKFKLLLENQNSKTIIMSAPVPKGLAHQDESHEEDAYSRQSIHSKLLKK